MKYFILLIITLLIGAILMMNILTKTWHVDYVAVGLVIGMGVINLLTVIVAWIEKSGK